MAIMAPAISSLQIMFLLNIVKSLYFYFTEVIFSHLFATNTLDTSTVVPDTRAFLHSRTLTDRGAPH